MFLNVECSECSFYLLLSSIDKRLKTSRVTMVGSSWWLFLKWWGENWTHSVCAWLSLLFCFKTKTLFYRGECKLLLHLLDHRNLRFYLVFRLTGELLQTVTTSMKIPNKGCKNYLVVFSGFRWCWLVFVSKLVFNNLIVLMLYLGNYECNSLYILKRVVVIHVWKYLFLPLLLFNRRLCKFAWAKISQQHRFFFISCTVLEIAFL